MNEHRPMPSHPEAERELLGWLMLGRDDTSEVFAMLKADDFHDARHVRVFEAMADLHRERKVIDLITVSSLMQSLGTMPYLAASGGDSYLSELMIGCSYFSTEQQLEHAGMVLDAARKRGIIMASAEMAERAYRGRYQRPDRGSVSGQARSDCRSWPCQGAPRSSLAHP